MLAKHLKNGQKFTVNKPDPEYPVRVCLENDGGGIIIWGFPAENLKNFWSMMGSRVEVENFEEKDYQCQPQA